MERRGSKKLLVAAALALVVALCMPARGSSQTFSDVPTNYWAYSFIETFAARGITSGCGGGAYCPEDSVTRAQMAVFLERGMQGASFVPPPATGTLFNDVGTGDFAAAFIEQLFQDGITGGCGGGDYCPDNQVTRAQMAVFLLRAMHGANYAPPPATGMFADVPPGSFADAWIEQLALEQITSGCGGGNFCPDNTVTRAQMAVFIVRALLEPSVLTSIQLSQSSLVLDRWGDSAAITAIAVDQDGFEVMGASISWLSSDAAIAAVDNAGNVSTWLGGDVTLTVEATKDDVTVNDTVAVTVAIQQNSNCTVPTEFPVQGPVAPPSLWDVRWMPTQIVPDTAGGNMVHAGIPLALDADLDGDNDLLIMTNTPENQGIEVPIDTAHALWLNDGNATFTDGTDAILRGNEIPWSAPRNISYADFDADGFRDIMVFQQGWELAENCETPGGCPGGPNLLFIPQSGGLSDTAPSRFNPYDSAQFTHSGAVADVDCDGDIDVLEAQWGVGGHHLQLNSGSGTFQADDSQLPQEVFTNVGISGSAMCDLDRDGDPDLVSVDGTVGVARPARLSVNNGFGQFRMLDEEVLPSIEADDGLECGDLDLNGYPDVVLNGEALLNQGDMAFVLDTSIDYTDIRSGDGVVDLNDDGWPDMPPEKNETLYWNVGGGVFNGTYMPNICCGSQPVVADFDMDGMRDIYLNYSNSIDLPNLLFINRPPPAPVKLVFATTDLYTGDLGGLTGADGICQQHATNASLSGTYVAYLSDSTTHALNRVTHGEYRRVGSGEVVVPSKLELFDTDVSVPVRNDEYGALIMADLAVRTGTEHGGRRMQAPGVGFCSDWTRDTNEDPGLAASGNVSGQLAFGGTRSGIDRPCSEPQRLYCFQQ